LKAMIRALGISVGSRSISQLTGVKSSILLRLSGLETENREKLNKRASNEIRTISQLTTVKSFIFLPLPGLEKESGAKLIKSMNNEIRTISQLIAVKPYVFRLSGLDQEVRENPNRNINKEIQKTSNTS
jgi:hypothetical protein